MRNAVCPDGQERSTASAVQLRFGNETAKAVSFPNLNCTAEAVLRSCPSGQTAFLMCFLFDGGCHQHKSLMHLNAICNKLALVSLTLPIAVRDYLQSRGRPQ